MAVGTLVRKGGHQKRMFVPQPWPWKVGEGERGGGGEGHCQ